MSTRGSSLLETLVALALLASAVLATIGLIVLGARQVESAERASRALARCTSVVERIESLGFERIWTSFGCDGLRPICVVDSVDAEVTLEALDAASLDTARSIRVTVVVSWTEGVRRRNVRLVTIRT